MTATLEEKENETAEETISRWLDTEYVFAEDRMEILLACVVMELIGLSDAERGQMWVALSAVVEKYQTVESREDAN